MCAAAVGLTRLRAQVEVEKLFAADSQILNSLRSLEERLGPLDQTEVLLVFEDSEPEQFPDRVKYVRKIQTALAGLPQISLAHSLINYLPSEPRKGTAMSFVRWSTYRNILRRERENLANGNFLHTGNGVEIWRIGLRFPFTKENDFAQLATDVERTADSIANQTDFPAVITAPPVCIYTGKTHLFQHAQMTLLQDLFQNFLLAFAIITPILIIVLRSIPLGLIAMLPNLFPVMVVFGGLGWCDFPVDLAIAMTASVALGIAVDDTTHFLIRFRDSGGSLRQGGRADSQHDFAMWSSDVAHDPDRGGWFDGLLLQRTVGRLQVCLGHLAVVSHRIAGRCRDAAGNFVYGIQVFTNRN